MADFNLTVVAVLDDDNRVIGVITVDDVLEAMLPERVAASRGGRRRLTSGLRVSARVVHFGHGNHIFGVYPLAHGRRRQSPVPATHGPARVEVAKHS